MSKILPGETDLYALTDSRLSLGRSIDEVALALLNSGIRIIQYREKKSPGRIKLEECKRLRKLTESFGACFIVNDHPDLAILSHADGIHLGQDDIPIKEARKLVGDMIIGLSTHSPEQAVKAKAEGADYIGVGPIFETHTKEDVVAPVGFEYLDWVVENINLPFVAIGGIKAHNIGLVASHGAKCCAMVSGLVGAPDISAKVEESRKAMAEGINSKFK